MSYVKIERSEEDKKFREIVKKLLDSAKFEIVIIAGELSSLYFPELWDSLKKAIERGVKVKIYAVEPPSNILRILKSIGCELKIGSKRPKDHFLVIDRKSCVISEKADVEIPTIGSRHGKYYPDNPSEAMRIIELFEKLGTNPLKKLLLIVSPLMVIVLFLAILVFNSPAEIVATSLVVASIIFAYYTLR
jgi:hypothetical protein